MGDAAAMDVVKRTDKLLKVLPGCALFNIALVSDKFEEFSMLHVLEYQVDFFLCFKVIKKFGDVRVVQVLVYCDLFVDLTQTIFELQLFPFHYFDCYILLSYFIVADYIQQVRSETMGGKASCQITFEL